MNQDNVRKIRREFAKLLKDDPEAFDLCVKEYQAQGAKAFPAQIGSGTTRKVPTTALAMLLASYQNRPGTRDEFLGSEAAKGIMLSDRFSSFRWNNEDNIRSHLKTAQRMAKQDASFAEDVDFYSWTFQTLGGFRSE